MKPISLRAVFAAIIWHAGVVQDGMACASYLKHTGLTKRESGVGAKKIGHEARSAKENKVKQRHSVEVISSAYLNYKEIDWQIVSFFTEIRKTKTMWQIWLIFVAAIYTLVS